LPAGAAVGAAAAAARVEWVDERQPPASPDSPPVDTDSEDSGDLTPRLPPPARTAPRGIKGLLDGGPGAYELLDVSSLPPPTVLVHIYDVGDEELVMKINRWSTVNDKVMVGGIFHPGVEIYGREWGYGFTEDDSSGVCFTEPRCHPQHRYKATVNLGPTEMSEADVDALISRLAGEWPGSDYELIHHNCCDFANALCLELGVGRMPGWIDRFGRTASKFDKFGRRTSQQLDHTKQLVRHATQDVSAAWMTSDISLTFREIGREVEEVGRWTLGPAREALGENLKSWGQSFVGGWRALADEGTKRPGRSAAAPKAQHNDLRAALRNRGGFSPKTEGGG